ncbi:MAG: glutamate synthase large subunit [Candidatus Cyclonatronum sp.]|uniref:glutamate synthase large subunit n=1 Tax=Cyclonatronum sp. TaxID=3024185 RepID=UPI0025C203A5|nr:glutamate synthase large subunit [Cyclonatronum sp.]MCH8487589.1 glutamate synthase large subunit [Cyclonatronum sp.]
MNATKHSCAPMRPPLKQGLYDPLHEHDACGIGFVANINGEASHTIVNEAIRVLHNLNHRGATGAEGNTGDGAGILMQIPHDFLKRSCEGLGFRLPEPGHYGVGMIFMPGDRRDRLPCERIVEKIIREEGLEVLGWRKVRTDNATLGETALASEPSVRQVFIGKGGHEGTALDLERKLFVVRRRATLAISKAEQKISDKDFFYINSLSSRTIVYKGMLTPHQLDNYYPELRDPNMQTSIALVHSRFSTNTFPSWKLAHPYRYIIHNGEINTVRGNQNWMHAREAVLQSPLFGSDLKKVLPIVQDEGSDSSKFDQCLEFLTLSGRSLPHAMMMMIPEPWEKHETMDDERRAFYEYHSCMMEPWDGPASVAFTDGQVVGATLDRNGLRPSRYYVTRSNMIVLASEAGVLDIPSDEVLIKGRLQPGRMLLIDTKEQRIISDEEIKKQVVSQQPYGQWLKDNLVDFETCTKKITWQEPRLDHEKVVHRQKVFGYTYEDLRINLGPMAENMLQPIGAMGNDAPLAVLSNQPQLLYNYFKQLFAQVTNPPIDPIREELITSTETYLGGKGNILEESPERCRQIKLPTPVLSTEEMEILRKTDLPGFRIEELPILFEAGTGGTGLEKALSKLFNAAAEAIGSGANILILTDRNFSSKLAPIPALLAISGLHHHLIRTGKRTDVSIVLESGEPRETHHFCTLLGYGVDAVNPYMAYESLCDLLQQGLISGIDYKRAVKGYNKAVVKGIVKVMAKMGISTVKSYRGAQIFEALGISKEVVDSYFTWTDSRIGGITLDTIAREAEMRHEKAYPKIRQNGTVLDEGGQYKWRRNGEYHMYNPKTVHTLQLATRTGDYGLYKEYARLLDEQHDPPPALRHLLELIYGPKPVPIEEVESVESICRRFKTGAMSYGSISLEAHEALAIAMNRLGGRSNTGEGGEDAIRYTEDANGDSRNSAIKQVASGRFGVTSEYLTQAKEIQIKMAQGAKPGEGGELPGRKVYPWIADVRLSTPGVGLISPPPHHDIYSIEDLAQLIHDLKNANDQADINVKLVSLAGVGTIAAGVAKAKADVILVSGHDGGTGASPQTSIKHAGLPWELGLAEVHQTLLLNNLRSRVKLETDGQIKTGRDIVVAALLGAEEFGFGTSALITLGCIMMRVCHLNTCPVGVATQDPHLRSKFTGDPQYVVNFMRFVAQDVREHMAAMGFRTIDEMIGRTDKLRQKKTNHWKAKLLDLSPVLHSPKVHALTGVRKLTKQHHGLENSMDVQMLLDLCEPALSEKTKVKASLPIRNTNRVTGTILGSEITRMYGQEGLPEDTIHLRFRGSAGQSFGAFGVPGVSLELEGDANDYFGKGLSGGKLILYPDRDARFRPEDNIIVGNVALYGATRGEAFIRGRAGERFCVRNSGAAAVVEGTGDHGCEYMTGGRAVILGPTGRNFAAGMSGGIAYVLDTDGSFPSRCNKEMVYLEKVEDESDEAELKRLIRRHADFTDSVLAWKILAKWEEVLPQFVKVHPQDYKRMTEAIQKAVKTGMDPKEAELHAFEANQLSEARAAGN